MMNLKTDKTRQLVPIFVALTLLYSLIYHIMMYHAILHEVDQDECAEQAHAGGIIPPQCLELEVFRDWHKKGAEELLIEVGTPEDQVQVDPAAKIEASHATIVVDESGETFAETISQDLAGLEKKMSQLVISSTHLDIKHEKELQASVNVSSDAPTSATKNLEALHELMQHNLGNLTSQEHHGDPDDANSDFATFHAKMQARHKRRAEARALLVREIAERMGKLDTKLADVVSDRKAWEATVLAKYDAANLTGGEQVTAAPVPKSTFMAKQLQWPEVPTVQHHPIVVSKRDVRHLHWTGKLPHVAAITWIRGSRKTKARMMYFLDNFKLQDYEGPRQLLLVYHYKDASASELVRQYADGKDIKGVSAHDFSQESFPSDPALRYAAWSSEADVIAQWDFDEWHDPSRLSLQVRAMAHTARHACVLSTSSTSHSQEDEAKEISVVSLVGERTWMKEHWHPFSSRSSEVNQTFSTGELVELDMQNKVLMNNVSRIEHVFVETTVPPSPAKYDGKSVTEEEEEVVVEEKGTQFSRGISECLHYDHSKGHASEDAAEKAISENVGKDFGKKFHDLVKRRRDVTMKLQLLCFQATMEMDTGKRKFMHDHVLEMDRIRVELDKHITNTAALFGGAANL